MKARVLFGVGGFAFVLLALYVFPPVVLETALVLLSMFAVYELIVPTKLVRSKTLAVLALLVSMVQAKLGGQLGSMTDGAFGGSAVWLPLLGVLVAAVLLALVILLRTHQRIQFQDVSAALFAALVLPLLMMSLWRIFNMPYGPFLILLPLLAAWGSDTCALFAGMAFGKHKLAPVISPKKTIEGAIGGVIGSAVLLAAVMFAYQQITGQPVVLRAPLTMEEALSSQFIPKDYTALSLGAAALLGAVGAAIGQIGDLSFSIIKRQTGIKDYGHIFPGHGGVLDRFDSVIFVAPVAELILRAFAA